MSSAAQYGAPSARPFFRVCLLHRIVWETTDVRTHQFYSENVTNNKKFTPRQRGENEAKSEMVKLVRNHTSVQIETGQ